MVVSKVISIAKEIICTVKMVTHIRKAPSAYIIHLPFSYDNILKNKGESTIWEE